MTKEISKKKTVPSSITKLISGISAPANELRRLMAVVAPTGSSALILGPTGSGKELVAKGIHAASGRKGPLISVNCAAIPTELLESELFGHEKGAFTGADKVRAGRFEQSSGGTLFLDEIGDMPLSLQSKLLRALENKTIQRVGGDKEIKIDLRLICATHQNIEKYVDEGKFRADLYFRINVFPIIVPSLAERIVDLQVIVEFMLNELKSLNWADATLSIRTSGCTPNLSDLTIIGVPCASLAQMNLQFTPLILWYRTQTSA